MRKRLLGGIASPLLALLLVAMLPLQAEASVTSFGAKLTSQSQPANAEGGYPCSEFNGIPENSNCTWVSVQAYHNGGHVRAPKTGTINKLKLVSCVGGSFRLQFARVSGRKAMIVRSGPTIKYKADPQDVCGGDNGDHYIVQSFTINVHVNKGDYIAIQTRSTGAMYCSGGNGTYVYTPPLPVGGAFTQATDAYSCNMLIQLFYAS